MNTWFIADPHFGHKNIIKYESRPFIDTEHMDNCIIENFNAAVSEGDLVFWLGDMFFCGSKRMEYIVSRLKKTRNILIRGNHDKGITDGKFIKLGFMPCKMYLFEEDWMLTHEPISEENMKHLESQGVYMNICGHLHSRNDDLNPERYCCISVENTGYRPISCSELFNRILNIE